MSKYAISGSTVSVPSIATDATGSTYDPVIVHNGIAVMGRNITAGRVLWLRHFHLNNTGASLLVALADVSVGAQNTATTTRAKILCASGNTTLIEFPKPGLKFSTGCCIHRDATATTATTVCYPGEIGGAGYEEG